MALIELTDIHKTYHLGQLDVPVLKGVSLSIERGEFVALMGASGSGKTTLMNLLGCLDQPTSGSCRFDGQEVSRMAKQDLAALRSRRIGFVFQNFNLLARTNAVENVLMPTAYAADNRSVCRGHTGRDIRTRCRTLLEGVGLQTRFDHEPAQLSGGQQQRVAIARALVNRPTLLLADEPTGNLDSKTSREILEMFQRLNAEEGITILLVTHDASVANHASRVIHIADGKIEGDTGQPAEDAETAIGFSQKSEQQPAARRDAVGGHRSRGHLASFRALCSTTRMAVRALRRNFLRSVLTTLGIVIGVSAVIAMMEISQGAATGIQQTISTMGANTLMVLPGTTSQTGVSMGSGSAMTLLPQDADAILNQCPSIRFAAPVVRARTQVVYGNRNWVPQYMIGTTPAFLDARDWTDLDLGQPFTDRDVRRGSKVCLIGQTVARELFGDESPIGKEVRVRNVPFRVSGVLSRKGANLLGVDQDDILLAPWTTMKYRVSGAKLSEASQSDSQIAASANPGPRPSLYPVRSPSQIANTPQPVRITSVDQVLVRATSADAIDSATEEITELLGRRHRIRPGETNDFRVKDMAEVSKALKTTVRLLSGLLLSVALISLVVGGVGIMNIMLVSVTERTREIGLRMAVGASARDILRQFLVEAIVLCLIGGLIGIAVGRGCSLLVRNVMNWPTEASLAAVAAAVAVSVTVGVAFGYYPAWKASRLDPIEALRYE